MRESSVTTQFLRTVGMFAFVGPFAGTVTVWALLLIAFYSTPGSNLREPWGVGTIGGFAILSLLVGYVLGVIPAAITGGLCHFFARAIRSDIGWTVACGLVGGMMTGALILGIQGGLPDWEAAGLLMALLPGLVAAAVCGWRLRRRRWA